MICYQFSVYLHSQFSEREFSDRSEGVEGMDLHQRS